MLFFLDSANIKEIIYAIEKWKINGITTNPRHIAAAGLSMEKFMNEVKEIVKGTDITVSVEVNPYLQTSEEMISEAEKLASISENFVIKIPATEEGFIALKSLSEKGIKVNVTLVFSVVQALQAARLGAFYISPFIGWREERGEFNIDFIRNVVTAVKNYGYDSKILIAAVRNAKHIGEAALIGADIVTAGFQVYKKAFDNPFTNMGLDIFKKFWDQLKEKRR